MRLLFDRGPGSDFTERHLENVYSRLGVPSRTAAVAWLIADAAR